MTNISKKKVMSEKEEIDQLEEIVDALIPVLEEMAALKKIVGDKVFSESVKKLEKLLIRK